MKSIAYFICFFLIVSCNYEAEPIRFNEDQCAYCKMTISDPKFGAELISDKGRIYKFDAVECLIPYMHENQNEYARVLSIAYDHPGQLYPIDSLTFLISDSIRSPMGANVLSFKDKSLAKKHAENGAVYPWKALQRKIMKRKHAH